MGRPKQNPNILPATQNNQQIANDPKDSREEKFLDLLFISPSIEQAGIQAGYSPNYSKSNIYQKFKSPTFQAKLAARYKDNCFTDLPLVQKISHMSLIQIKKDLEQGNTDSVAKLKHIPRQILEITRLLTPEGLTGVNMVHIDSLQMIVGGKFNGKPDPTDSSAE